MKYSMSLQGFRSCWLKEKCKVWNCSVHLCHQMSPKTPHCTFISQSVSPETSPCWPVVVTVAHALVLTLTKLTQTLDSGGIKSFGWRCGCELKICRVEAAPLCCALWQCPTGMWLFTQKTWASSERTPLELSRGKNRESELIQWTTIYRSAFKDTGNRERFFACLSLIWFLWRL